MHRLLFRKPRLVVRGPQGEHPAMILCLGGRDNKMSVHATKSWEQTYRTSESEVE